MNNSRFPSKVFISGIILELHVDWVRITYVGLSWLTYADAIMLRLQEGWVKNTSRVYNSLPHLIYVIYWDNTKLVCNYAELCVQQMSCNIRVCWSIRPGSEVTRILGGLSGHQTVENSACSIWGINGIGWRYEARSDPAHWFELVCIAILPGCLNPHWWSISWLPIKSLTQLLNHQSCQGINNCNKHWQIPGHQIVPTTEQTKARCPSYSYELSHLCIWYLVWGWPKQGE